MFQYFRLHKSSPNISIASRISVSGISSLYQSSPVSLGVNVCKSSNTEMPRYPIARTIDFSKDRYVFTSIARLLFVLIKPIFGLIFFTRFSTDNGKRTELKLLRAKKATTWYYEKGVKNEQKSVAAYHCGSIIKIVPKSIWNAMRSFHARPTSQCLCLSYPRFPSLPVDAFDGQFNFRAVRRYRVN